MPSHTNGGDKSHVDVLIVGAGPAGLMAATWMSRLGIKTRIVDKRGTKVYNGQADGLQARTLEIFDCLGVYDDIAKVSNRIYEFTAWVSEADGKGIERLHTTQDPLSSPDVSRFTQHVLNQGYIESQLLKTIDEHSTIKVERGVLPISLEIDESQAEDPHAYPVTVTLQHLTEEETTPFQVSAHHLGKKGDGLFRSNLAADDTDDLIERAKSREGEEVVHAKYMIGTEGAHSWTRRQLGFEMEGESTDYIWGAMDVIPITDFPDIRKPGTIQTKLGSMLVIPREKKLTRLYVQLKEVNPENGHVDRSKITPDQILATARKILHPYKLEYTYCDWWTAYQVGQRVGNHYSDKTNHVFLAGDAVHTHSPKAGQGMNVSMQDTFNLGWKLGGVINRQFDRKILDTYEYERKTIAHQLIAFDHELSGKFSRGPSKEDLSQMYFKHKMFVSGCGIQYPPNLAVAAAAELNGHATEDATAPVNPVTAKQSLAGHIPLGVRLRGRKVVNHSDGIPYDLQHWLHVDGRWRLIVFPGDIGDAKVMGRYKALGEALSAQGGIMERYTHHTVSPPSMESAGRNLADVKRKVCMLQLLTVYCGDRTKFDITDFPSPFLQWDKEEGYDYNSIFADDKSSYDGSSGNIYENCQIDRKEGCMVLVRPDHFVSWIGSLEDVKGLDNFLQSAGFQTGIRGMSEVCGRS